MLHAEESTKYEVINELHAEEEIELDKKSSAIAEWAKNNFASEFEIFVAISLLVQRNPKNVELDFLECIWVYCELGNRQADETNKPRDFDNLFSYEREAREIGLELFKQMKHPKKQKKAATKIIKNLQKKGLIEIVHRNNWHQYIVNVIDPIKS